VPAVQFICHHGVKDWLEKLPDAGIRRGTDRLYEQLDHLIPMRQEARKELVAESHKHTVTSAKSNLSLHQRMAGLGEHWEPRQEGEGDSD
jgi:hypothetical protein